MFTPVPVLFEVVLALYLISVPLFCSTLLLIIMFAYTVRVYSVLMILHLQCKLCTPLSFPGQKVHCLVKPGVLVCPA